MTRSTLLSGPASATFNGHTFFAHDGILVTPALEFAEKSDAVNSDAWGALDETVSGAMVKIQFTPSAPVADLLAFYPHTQAIPGMSLFGPADVSLTLIASNGMRLTFAAVAIVQMPDLILTNRGAMTGAVTFLAMGARGLGLTSANRFVAVDTAPVPLPPIGTPQLADDFAITWGGAPWIDLRAQDGVRLGFALKTRAVLSDANALPGRLLSTTATTLDVAGDHLFVRLPLAQLTRGELVFDATHGRMGEWVFTAGRAFLGTGAAAPLVTLTEGIPA